MPRLFPHNAFHGIRSIGSKAALSRQRVISALVADGAVGNVAALGDGDCDLRLDPGHLGGTGQHDCA